MSIIALGRNGDVSSRRSAMHFANALGNDEWKESSRNTIADFVCEHVRTGRERRVFSMPGASWAFERTMESRLGSDTQFVACERNWHVILAGLQLMPGARRMVLTCELRGGAFDYVQSSRSVVANCELATLVRGPDARASRTDRCRFRDAFRHIDAIWIDYSGPLGEDALISLPRLQCVTRRSNKKTPCVVSFMVGRERRPTSTAIEISEGREQYAERLLSSCNHGRWETVKTFGYRGNGVEMLVVMGVFHAT
jgi:hypothetical protein